MNAEREALQATAREFVRREVVPHLQQWEDDGAVPRELHRAPPEPRACSGSPSPRAPAARAATCRLGRPPGGDVRRRGVQRADGGAVHRRHRAAAHRGVRQPGPRRPVRPADPGRRDDRGAGRHRARRRLRRRRHPDDRAPRRRPLRRQRRQDLHHLRRPRRLRHHRRPHRRPGPRRHLAAGGREGHARASPSAGRWPRSAGTAPTPPSCPSPTSGSRRPTWSARRTPASTRSPSSS